MMTGCLLTQVGARIGRRSEVCPCCGFSAQGGENRGSPKCPESMNSFRESRMKPAALLDPGFAAA